ncbi:MAG: cephalosporin hydroxylase family protein [Acidobacteriota bacterium]
MKLVIDTSENTLSYEREGSRRTVGLYTKEAFEVLTLQWLKIGWNEKATYTYTWLGRPIIQLPDDMIRMQEVIYTVRPDFIIETGVAHGGSLVFYASLCKLMGRGRVIGIDIEIRRHNRQAIEAHPLFPLISLVEGDSVLPKTVAHVRSLLSPGEKGLVILDSSHTKAHVRAELDVYHAFVSPGSYIVATDGIMRELHDVPRGKSTWASDNPAAAAIEFAAAHPEFVLEQPPWLFNESRLDRNITHWPAAWLRRRTAADVVGAGEGIGHP